MNETGPGSSSESDSQSPQNGDTAPTNPGTKKRGSKSSKPRLTAVQKNTNHKDAENKRRNAIRERFTELSHIVPGAEGQERSEHVMIQKTRVYIEDTTNEIRELERQALELGIPLDPKDLTKDTGYGGSAWKQPHLAQYEKDKAKKASKSGKALDDADGEAEDDV